MEAARQMQFGGSAIHAILRNAAKHKGANLSPRQVEALARAVERSDVQSIILDPDQVERVPKTEGRTK